MLAVPLLTDIDAGLVGILLVMVGGVIAGIALINPPDRNAGYEAGAAAMLSEVDPLAHADSVGSPPIRRFLFGVVLLGIGAAAVVVAG